ncbi:MAG: hypothetical protein INR67_21280, partial [Jatrophihabitans endophyticus]|nr:hypothetical protein [Jatrophihabitans endophyticus]
LLEPDVSQDPTPVVSVQQLGGGLTAVSVSFTAANGSFDSLDFSL